MPKDRAEYVALQRAFEQSFLPRVEVTWDEHGVPHMESWKTDGTFESLEDDWNSFCKGADYMRDRMLPALNELRTMAFDRRPHQQMEVRARTAIGELKVTA